MNKTDQKIKSVTRSLEEALEEKIKLEGRIEEMEKLSKLR